MIQKIPTAHIQKLVALALKEDGAKKDITTRLLIPSQQIITAKIIFKENNAVVCGVDIVREVFRVMDSTIKIKFLKKDGDRAKQQDVFCVLTGKARSILMAERVALNFLGILSGLATTTRRYVQAVQPYGVDILDTRKTTPLLRIFERFAIRVGGGKNHRFNLTDMVLVKDNHRILRPIKKSLANMVVDLRKKTKLPIEVEVDSLEELKDVLPAKPDMILLDNMSIGLLKKAVFLTHQMYTKNPPLLEASGGITMKNITSIAKTGVDRISLGALTHTRRAIDVSMEF